MTTNSYNPTKVNYIAATEKNVIGFDTRTLGDVFH